MTYNDYIKHIIDVRGQWGIPLDEYFEAHHIIPKCLGGDGNCYKGRQRTNDKNIIWLYPEEHFIAHKLLAEENPNNNKLVLAWSMMAFPKGKTKRNIEISSEDYAKIRKMQSKISKENNNYLSNNGHPWCWGLTKETDERIKKIAEKTSANKKGVKLGPDSEEVKHKKSLAQIKRYKEHPETFTGGPKGMIAINNGVKCIYINKNDTIPDGYVLGQGKRNQYVIKDKEAYSKMLSERFSGNKNPMYGKGYKLAGGNNGHAIYIYTFENIDYQCRDDLMKVLKEKYPDISESTIRRIMRNNYTEKISSKFQYVIDNLSWRLKSENKINTKD